MKLTLTPGPQTFRPKDAPRYAPAEVTIVCCWGACIVDLLFIWWYYRHENRKKAAIRAQPEYRKLENQEWLDLTDKYVLPPGRFLWMTREKVADLADLAVGIIPSLYIPFSGWWEGVRYGQIIDSGVCLTLR